MNLLQEDKKDKYIEEEGLADYWDALKAERDKPWIMGRALYYKEKYGL